jgi:hypothetical protein
MKLTALHESTLAGYGMAYQVLGAKPKELVPDMFRPKGIERWYHRNSPLTLRHREQLETEFPSPSAEPSTLAESAGQQPKMTRVTVPVGFIEADLIIKRESDGVVNGFWDLTEDAYNTIKNDPYEQTNLLHAAARILYAIVEWGENDWRSAAGGKIRKLNIHDHNEVPTVGQVIGLDGGYTAHICDGGPDCPDNRPVKEDIIREGHCQACGGWDAKQGGSGHKRGCKVGTPGASIDDGADEHGFINLDPSSPPPPIGGAKPDSEAYARRMALDGAKANPNTFVDPKNGFLVCKKCNKVIQGYASGNTQCTFCAGNQQYPHAMGGSICGVTGLPVPCGCFACQAVTKKP